MGFSEVVVNPRCDSGNFCKVGLRVFSSHSCCWDSMSVDSVLVIMEAVGSRKVAKIKGKKMGLQLI